MEKLGQKYFGQLEQKDFEQLLQKDEVTELLNHFKQDLIIIQREIEEYDKCETFERFSSLCNILRTTALSLERRATEANAKVDFVRNRINVYVA